PRGRLALAGGARRGDLLARGAPPRDGHDAHDVTGDAAGQGGEDLFGPLLERLLPGQVQQGRIGAGRGDLQGCHDDIVSCAGALRPLGARFSVLSSGSYYAETGYRDRYIAAGV